MMNMTLTEIIVKPHKALKKVPSRRGQRPPNPKWKRKAGAGVVKSRSKFPQAIPDTSGIPWLGPRTEA
jgi:hypothetical protein